MSIKILRGKDRLFLFLLFSTFMHIGILMLAPYAKESKKILPKLIPVDVIEFPQKMQTIKPLASNKTEKKKPETKKATNMFQPPLPKITSLQKETYENKELTKTETRLPALPPDKMEQFENKTKYEPLIKKESADDEKLQPLDKTIDEKPLNLFPTKERISELSEKYEKEVPLGEKDKDISFDTSEPRFTSYFERLKAKIYHEWDYPEAAYRQGQSGKLFISFVILKDGSLENVTLIKGSGYPILDNSAISAIRLAAPFYPFQKSFGSLEKITVNASFEYILDRHLYRHR